MSEPVKGSCLCGGVSYEFSGSFGIFQYCRCSRCRKFTGSAFAANILVPPDKFTWTSGQELIGRFELEDTRHFATGFCKKCGSSLPWLTQSGKSYVVGAGTLDDDPGIRPMQNIQCASQAEWFTYPHELPEYDEYPG